MNEQESTRIARQACENFKKGDISSLLDSYSEDDVDWHLLEIENVSFRGKYKWRQETAKFFQSLNAVISFDFSMFVFAPLCLFSIVIVAKPQTFISQDKQMSNVAFAEMIVVLKTQDSTQQKPGAPLKGVDVKLGKNPGGQVVSRTSDKDGNFDFGVLPKGSYYLTVSFPEEIKSAATSIGSRESSQSNSSVKNCLISINNGMGETIKSGWDFEKKRAFNPAAKPNEKIVYQEKIIFESDGQHPISGAVVKSKSNISNN